MAADEFFEFQIGDGNSLDGNLRFGQNQEENCKYDNHNNHNKHNSHNNSNNNHNNNQYHSNNNSVGSSKTAVSKMFSSVAG